MFTVELYAKIRHVVMVDGLSRREAAKRFAISPQYDHEDAEFFSSARLPPERPASKKLGPYMAWIDAILAGDSRVHKKQQHTAHRIFEGPRDERGFTGGYTIVREYVAQAMLRTREMFVPLSHCPGHAQPDFGEADGYIGGKKVRSHYFCMDLPHSDGCFVKAYPAETAEAFCDGHVAAIDFFGGVPELVIARCDAPEILEPSETARDDVAPFVGLPVVADASCGWICPGRRAVNESRHGAMQAPGGTSVPPEQGARRKRFRDNPVQAMRVKKGIASRVKELMP